MCETILIAVTVNEDRSPPRGGCSHKRLRCADVAITDIAGALRWIPQDGLIGQLTVIFAAVDRRKAGIDERPNVPQPLQHLDDQVRARFRHGVAQHAGGTPKLIRSPAVGCGEAAHLPAEALQFVFKCVVKAHNWLS
jgi:hypothetical protein